MNIDMEQLRSALHKSRKGSQWKKSVMQWEISRLPKLCALQKQLRDDYKPDTYKAFRINERGRMRLIRAQSVRDRITQHVLCDDYINPVIEKRVVWDNGASRKGKGTSFTRRRLCIHLNKYWLKYHNWDGYILKIDFSKYYDNIQHGKLKQQFQQLSLNDDIRQLIDVFIDSNRTKVPADWDFTQPLNLLTVTGLTKEANISMGIGAQLSQSTGILYATPIDTLIKNVYSCGLSGRYNDDIYVIERDKNKLQVLLYAVEEEANKWGIFINHKKTVILPLRKGFTFLKTHYILKDNGKIIKRADRRSFTRERQRLRAMHKEGIQDINQYRAWRNAKLKQFHCWKLVKNMDDYYNRLYGYDSTFHINPEQ